MDLHSLLQQCVPWIARTAALPHRIPTQRFSAGRLNHNSHINQHQGLHILTSGLTLLHAHTHQHTANTPQTRRARPCPKCHSLPTCWWHNSAAGLLKTFLEFKMTNGMPYGLHGQVPMAQMCKKCAVWYGTGVMSCLATLDSGTWRLHNLKSRYWSVIDSVTSITKTKLHCHAQCILQTAVHSVTWKQTGVMNQEQG